MGASSSKPAAGLRVTLWGTRGGVPSPGADTLHFGGNTSCVEVVTRDRRLILDAGTGIVPLGRSLGAPGVPSRLEIFLTHFHWDHIQGLPFFGPLQDPFATIRIHALRQNGVAVRELLEAQMRVPYFPVPLDSVAAGLEYRDLEEGPWLEGELSVSCMRMRHPGDTCGLRVRSPAGTIVYIPDNEPHGEGYPVSPSWEDEFLEFTRGADVLIHDAMYTDAEYAGRRGWGHGTFGQAARLAAAAGVGRLLLFHHAAERTDAELRGIVERLRRENGAQGTTPMIEAAHEGRVITLP